MNATITKEYDKENVEWVIRVNGVRVTQLKSEFMADHQVDVIAMALDLAGVKVAIERKKL